MGVNGRMLHFADGAPASLTDRRSGADRRRRHVRAFFYQFVCQRRHGDRRASCASHHACADVHHPLLLLLTLSVLLLCIVDSYNTLALLDQGGVELNPFMRQLIEQDVVLFFGVKYVMTAAGLVVLVVFNRVRLLNTLSGNHLIGFVLLGYGVLIGYQYWLLGAY